MSQIKEKSVLVCECVLRGESGCQGATVLVKRDARVSESWGREWGESGETGGDSGDSGRRPDPEPVSDTPVPGSRHVVLVIWTRDTEATVSHKC